MDHYQPLNEDNSPPPQVILRVKRRREEPPVELLVVEAASKSKQKKAKGADGLAEQLASLSTDARKPDSSQEGQSQGSGTKRRFYFTRVETIDAMDVQAPGGVRRSSVARGGGDSEDQGPYREVRRFKSTTYNGAHPGTGGGAWSGPRQQDGAAFHLIDLAFKGRPAAENQQEKGGAEPRAAGMQQDGPAAAAERPHYIFGPLERDLDEAIFRVFQGEGTVAQMMDIIHRGADVNFQRRNADDTTALAAAAYVGDVAGLNRLLRAGANPNIRDMHGKVPLDIANDRGHLGCQILLRQAMVDGAEEDEEDYVFDVYSVHKGASQEHEPKGPEAEAPVVQVAGLAYRGDGQGQGQGQGCEDVLVFEDDSDWSDDDQAQDDDQDSNDENYFANDYPEEEDPSDDDDDHSSGRGASDSDEAEGRMTDIGFRMNQATRRHMIHDLARGRQAAGRLLGGQGRPAYEGDSTSDEGDYGGLVGYDGLEGAEHLLGAPDSDDDAEDEEVMGEEVRGDLLAARRAAQAAAASRGMYSTYAFDSEEDLEDDEDDD